MATCKDCVHVEVCCSHLSTAYNKCKLATPDFELLKNIECDECQHFKDRFQFVELPYKIGDKAFRIAGNGEIEEGDVKGFFFGAGGQTLEIVFSTEPEHCGVINEAFVKKTREEAEQALNCGQSNISNIVGFSVNAPTTEELFREK